MMRAFKRSFLGQLEVFKEAEHVNIEGDPVDHLEEEVREVNSLQPGTLPAFVKAKYRSHSHAGTSYYKVSGIRSYLVSAIARLDAELETVDGVPVTQTLEFGFIKDVGLRKLVERDYNEIQRAFVVNCHKAVIVLCGGTIEAILAALLLANDSDARSAGAAPRKDDILAWSLSDLIEVSVELELISKSTEKLSQSVREYRNLVHPGNELRNGLSFGREEASIALEVLHIVHRDLAT